MLPNDNQQWAMEPDRLTSMLRAMPRANAWPTRQQIAECRAAAAGQLKRVTGKVAVVPMYGVVEQRMSAMGFLFGGVSTEDVGKTIDSLMANREVQAVVFDVDSPGGTVPGVMELAAKIHGYRETKPMYAISNSLMASAAYWIGSAANTLISTPSGETGSVGVIGVHADVSGMLEAQGVKVTVIRSGRYKGESNPYEPLSQEAKDHLQESFDETYGLFVGAVAKHRGKSAGDVRKTFGEGRVLSASKALEVGMIDKVMTFEQLLAKLSGTDSTSQKRASVEVLRMRQAHRERIARVL